MEWWNKESTLFFIELIRERPVLWDVTLEDHRNKYKKQDALSDIAKILGKTREEINSKWISLKGQYNREKKKVTGLRTGSGATDIYNSKWFAYQEMSSLLSCNIPQESISNYAISPPPPPAMPTPSPPAMLTPPPSTLTPPPSTPTPPPSTPTPPPSTPTPLPTTSTPLPPRVKGPDALKRKRNSGLYGEALLTLKAIKERKSKTVELEDEITTYGLYIAAQMRKFQPILQSKLKLDIQSLLCKYEIENIEYTSRSASSISDCSEINNLNTLDDVSYSFSPSSPIEHSCAYREPDIQILPTRSPIASTSTFKQPNIQILPTRSPIASTSTFKQPNIQILPTRSPIASTSTIKQPDTPIIATTADTGPTASASANRIPDKQSLKTLAIQSKSYLVISKNGSLKEVTGNQIESTIETKQANKYLLKLNK